MSAAGSGSRKRLGSMVQHALSFTLLLHACTGINLVTAEPHVFGKYFLLAPDGHSKDYSDNSYYLYKPTSHPSLSATDPPRTAVVFQAYGSGWIYDGYGPLTTSNPLLKDYKAHGIAFVSTGYRHLNKKYFYQDAAVTKEEEFIHIGKNGKLMLDSKGKTISDYKIQTSFMELITKSIFDVTQSLEHLIEHAEEFNLDPHRIVLLASSAGNAPQNYLAWFYHQWNAERFTPLGMILDMPQFNLPVIGGALDTVWQSYLNHFVEGTTVSEIGLSFELCGTYIGCPSAQAMGRCNPDWDRLTSRAYCNSSGKFDVTTLTELNTTQKWAGDLSGYEEGLKKLWLPGQAMLKYHPKQFHILAHPSYVWNKDNRFMHHPMYVQEYAEHADLAGINYTAYYPQYAGMRQDLPQFQHIHEDDLIPYVSPDYKSTHVRYVSSTNWRSEFAAIRNMGVSPSHLYFVCLMANVPSCVPQPSPSRLSSAKKVAESWQASADSRVPLLSLFGVAAVAMVGVSSCRRWPGTTSVKDPLYEAVVPAPALDVQA